MRVDFKDPAQADAYHLARLQSFKQRRKHDWAEQVARGRRVRGLVDIGCGTGPILELARNAGWFHTLAGCEPEDHLLAVAQRRVPQARLVRGLFDNFELPDMPVLLLFNDVYHHIEDKPQALRKLRTHCQRQPSSAVVIFEPNCYNPLTFVHQLRDDGVRLSFMHQTTREFREAGFEVDTRFICFGKDATEQSTLAKRFEGSLLSGVCLSVLTAPTST
jgi:trans-aconitate methyltransferase